MGGGGQHKSNLRFYAWAAHEQMPLRQVLVDWGDGKSQVIDDTRLKNRKPFCGVQKECEFATGLTCQIDSDCPPAAGRCKSVGTCEKTPQKTCSVDSDCTVGAVKDTCNIRTMFGNSTDACQQDYFDFAHSYECGAVDGPSLTPCAGQVGGYTPLANQCYFGVSDGLVGEGEFSLHRVACSVASDCTVEWNRFNLPSPPLPPPLPVGTSCGRTPVPISLVTIRCSRDPARSCIPGLVYPARDSCAPGDTCIDSLAPPSGCFDATSNSCRFTPRVMVQDNRGWCSGECRNTLVAGNLEDVGNIKVKHPFGGCYTGNVFNGTDKERVRFNTQSTVAEPVFHGTTEQQLYVVSDGKGQGECKLEQLTGSAPDPSRPWIVYPGSLQLRRSDEIAR